LQPTRDERFEDLFQENYAAVHGYALRRASRDAAQDVLAETFLVAWRRLDDIPLLTYERLPLGPRARGTGPRPAPRSEVLALLRGEAQARAGGLPEPLRSANGPLMPKARLATVLGHPVTIAGAFLERVRSR
jgi:hypothetical protein